MRTLPGQDALLRQPRLAATGGFPGAASRVEFSGLEGWRWTLYCC